MHEFITISLPTTMPLIERLSEANRQLSEWLESLENPFDIETDTFELKKCNRTDNEYSYHYTIIRGSRISAKSTISPFKSI